MKSHLIPTLAWLRSRRQQDLQCARPSTVNTKPSGQTVSNYGLSFQGDCWVAEFTILPPVRPRPWQIAKLWDSRPCIDSPGCRSPKWQFSRPGQPRRKACCCEFIIKDEAAKCHKGTSYCNRNHGQHHFAYQHSPQHVATKTSSRGSVDARADAHNRGVHFYSQTTVESFLS